MKHTLFITALTAATVLGACNPSSDKIDVVEIEDAKPLSATEHPYPEMEAAAEAGNARAQFNMGVLYDSGTEIIENDEKAIEWYKKSALQGFPPAHMSLADMYEKGHSVERDITKATRGYHVAAQGGVIEAQLKLGDVYEFGNDVIEPNQSQSYKWFRAAARQGDPDGQARLGAKYGNGQGTEKNLVKAYMWSSLGAENAGTQALVNKMRVEAAMSKEELTQANLLIEQCRSSEFQDCETLK